MSGPVNLQSGWLSPIHHSANGIHADFNPFDGGPKLHIPYQGQTTLDMYRIGGRPSYDTYHTISQNNFGSLRPDRAF